MLVDEALENVIERANAALYVAKEGGGNRVELATVADGVLAAVAV
ncbi:MAG: hypothetical protein ACU84Q_00375 [Gammaproteobacteria bacterium]